MPGDTSSKRIRYPLNPGDSLEFRISSVKNNVATPFTVKYTEKGTNCDIISKEHRLFMFGYFLFPRISYYWKRKNSRLSGRFDAKVCGSRNFNP